MNSTVAPHLTKPRKGAFALTALQSWNFSRTVGIALFFAVHIPLAILMMAVPAIATAHALVTFAVGIWFAASWGKFERVAYIAAYITGAEALWRMTRASIFWESGKYAIIAILLISIVRSGRLKGTFGPVLYFALLLPSLVLPVINVSSSELQDQVSFNLSGPLALAVCVWFFHGLELTYAQAQRVFLALIGPAVGVAAVAIFSTLSAGAIYFSNNSNFVTSGGFGPNQVSAALGLAALFAFLLLLDPLAPRNLKILLTVVMLVMLAQSALTFSRGGIYTSVAAGLSAIMLLIRVPRTRLKVFGGVLFLVLLTNFVLLPSLDSFTDGAFSRRFANTKLTGRDRLVQADINAWSENPIFGVGPGQAKSYRGDYRADTSAHTEFSRMLAEHGTFGLAALIALLAMALQHFRRARPGHGTAYAAALMIWSFFYMLTAAMRLVAPAFTFGLAALTIIPDREVNHGGYGDHGEFEEVDFPPVSRVNHG
jgi:O-antigen ligase